MKRIYYLSSCDTCRRMMKEFNALDEFELIDIKSTHIDAETLDFLKEKVDVIKPSFRLVYLVIQTIHL